MSGIAGILNLDRKPVDQSTLRRMTNFMSFRGPDSQEIWGTGHIGFGHALLKTTGESEFEHQPLTLDGHVWIVADARVDAQLDLIGKLEANGPPIGPRTPDVELILRAYLTWGEECVKYLLGDFAFAIWDGLSECLFCARDHLGVKPFFYTYLRQQVIFSNTLDCVRQHDAVSGTLNDLAIADFLLFGLNQEPDTTSFADIRRLPPAHCATWSRDGLKIRRYWILPIEEPVYLNRAEDYVEQFRELLHNAVRDRLRTDRVGVLMSGGLDSTALAATAKALLGETYKPYKIHAFTTVLDGVIDRNEQYYAGLAATHLGIPIYYRNLLEEMLNRETDCDDTHSSEPFWNPMQLAGDRKFYQSASSLSRVIFYGEGPDNALEYEWRAHLSFLIGQHRFGRLIADVVSHVLKHRRIPLLPTLPALIRQRCTDPDWTPRYPSWLNRTFETALDLRNRWEQRLECYRSESDHPVRPISHGSFTGQLWEPMLVGLDAGSIVAPVEVRHPFLDLRLLQYMLRVPAMPWCRAKYLLRRAMLDVLPTAILRRPKSTLVSDPSWNVARMRRFAPFRRTPLLGTYLDTDQLPKTASIDMIAFRTDFRATSLDCWLHTATLPITAERTAPMIMCETRSIDSVMSEARKPYEAPELRTYGDLREVTNKTGNNHPDGNGGNKS